MSTAKPSVEGYLHMWVVYDHPRDFPDYYVARLWLVDGAHAAPTTVASASTDLDALRRLLAAMGHVNIDRSPGDDPAILEIWL